MSALRHAFVRLWYLPLYLFVMTSSAYASGTGMPWETPLQNILDSITGPVAKAGGIIAIVAAGLGFAFGESGGMMRRVMSIVFGLAIVFAAAQWGMTFFGFAGGASF